MYRFHLEATSSCYTIVPKVAERVQVEEEPGSAATCTNLATLPPYAAGVVAAVAEAGVVMGNVPVADIAELVLVLAPASASVLGCEAG